MGSTRGGKLDVATEYCRLSLGLRFVVVKSISVAVADMIPHRLQCRIFCRNRRHSIRLNIPTVGSVSFWDLARRFEFSV
jgi:hypothetical protein